VEEERKEKKRKEKKNRVDYMHIIRPALQPQSRPVKDLRKN
jgi:hypothetical protein